MSESKRSLLAPPGPGSCGLPVTEQAGTTMSVQADVAERQRRLQLLAQWQSEAVGAESRYPPRFRVGDRVRYTTARLVLEHGSRGVEAWPDGKVELLGTVLEVGKLWHEPTVADWIGESQVRFRRSYTVRPDIVPAGFRAIEREEDGQIVKYIVEDVDEDRLEAEGGRCCVSRSTP